MSARPGSSNRKRAKVQISITGGGRRALHGYLKSNLRKAHHAIGSRLRDLSIALVDDPTMSRLHKRYMGIPGPTDVLTFPLELDSRKKPIGGEIVICAPLARRRASEIGIPVAQEVLLYALHGLLHLSGFDDRTARQYRRMHRMEDTILRRIGVGPVFSPRRAPDRSKAAATAKGRRR